MRKNEELQQVLERANKVVVEARRTGAGMHWSRLSVNPLLAVRNAVCTDRWAEAWQQRVAHIQREGVCWRPGQTKSDAATEPPIGAPAPLAAGAPRKAADPVVEHKPPAEHPWRRKNHATKAAIAQAKL